MSCLKAHSNFHVLQAYASSWFPSALSNMISWVLDSNASSHDTYTRVVDGQPRLRDYSTTGTQRDLQPGRCYAPDGVSDYLSCPHLSGSETVTSSSGTSTPSISAGRIDLTAGTIWDIVLSDGTRYNCDEGDGVVALDSSGNGNHGTITNATLSTFHDTTSNDQYSWQNQVGYSRARQFASGETITLNDGAALQFTGDYSVSGWVYLRSGTGFSTICGRWGSSQGWMAGISTNRIRVYRDTAYLQSNATLNYNQWYHVVVTANGATCSIYIDGSLDRSGNLTGGKSTHTNAYMAPEIGRYYAGMAGTFLGMLHNVVVYDTAISSGDVTSLYGNTVPGTPVGRWTLQGLSTDPIADLSGNGNNGTATGTTVPMLPRDESDTTKDISGNTLQYSGRCPVEHNLSGIPCLTLDGTNDIVDIGDISSSIDDITIWVKQQADNQEILSLQNSSSTVIRVSSGVLTFGGSLTLSQAYVDDVAVSVATAGATLNDNGWHKLRAVLSSAVSASDLQIGGYGATVGNISVAGLQVGASGADGHWPIEEGPGDSTDNVTCYDVSGNGNNGTITNGTVATVWSTRDKGPAYTVENGYRSEDGVLVPALADGSNAANGSAITSGPGVMPPGHIADPTQGESNVPELQLVGLNTSVEVGDSTADPNFARDDGDTRDRMIICEDTLSGADATNIAAYLAE